MPSQLAHWGIVRSTVPLVLGLALTLAGCKDRAHKEVDFGSIKNSVYRNEYFGLSVSFPSGWTTLDQAAHQQSRERGAAALAGNNQTLKRQLKASDMDSVPLFAAYKRPLGSPPPNASISGGAERVGPDIRRAADYLLRAREILKSGQMTVKFPRESYSQKIDGVDFDVLDVEMLKFDSTAGSRGSSLMAAPAR